MAFNQEYCQTGAFAVHFDKISSTIILLVNSLYSGHVISEMSLLLRCAAALLLALQCRWICNFNIRLQVEYWLKKQTAVGVGASNVINVCLTSLWHQHTDCHNKSTRHVHILTFHFDHCLTCVLKIKVQIRCPIFVFFVVFFHMLFLIMVLLF